MIIENETPVKKFKTDIELDSKLSCKVNAYTSMISSGFCYLHSNNFILSSSQEYNLDLIKKHFEHLAIDPYDQNSGRYR